MSSSSSSSRGEKGRREGGREGKSKPSFLLMLRQGVRKCIFVIGSSRMMPGEVQCRQVVDFIFTNNLSIYFFIYFN